MMLRDQRVRFILIVLVLLALFKVDEWLWLDISPYLGVAVSVVLLPLVSMFVMWKGNFLYRTFQWYPLAWTVFVFSAIPPLFACVALLLSYNWVELAERLIR